MKGWRALLSKVSDRRRASPPTVADDPFRRPDNAESAPPDALSAALDEIEAGALALYAAAGLPTRPGHYRRGPRASTWVFLAAHLTPTERFELTLKHPPEKGWRFARLQDLGARSDREDLRAASRLLGDVAEIRTVRGPLTREHLLTAMELGGAWRALRDARTVRVSRLTLTAPSKARSKRDKPPPAR